MGRSDVILDQICFGSIFVIEMQANYSESEKAARDQLWNK